MRETRYEPTLTWPPGWPTTGRGDRKHSNFESYSVDYQVNELLNEIRRFGGEDVVLTANLPLARYEGYKEPRLREEKDRMQGNPGVSVWFLKKGKPFVMACDTFLSPSENFRSIFKTIDAIRGIERWGASSMAERAFEGFAALPPPVAVVRR